VPTIADPDDFVSALKRPPRNGANDGVQAGAVAAAGEDPDPFPHREIMPLRARRS
jgi:hypothetical protein